jgi:pSer/pThr/pTyr-binding forkhead associated (FHA) protein
MAFELVIADGNGRGRRFRFDAREVSIGRAAENDFVVYDPRASRGHARICARGDGYALVDDGSCNGTQLNGREAFGATRLTNGDRIRLGSTVLEFSVRREPAAVAQAKRVLEEAAAAVRRWPSPVRVAVIGAGVAALVASALLCTIATGHRAVAPLPSIAAGSNGSGGTVVPMPEVPNAAEMFPDGSGELRAIRERYERGRRRLEERRIAPRNLYDAWRAFAAAASALEAVAADLATQATLQGLIRWTEGELETECKRLLFAAARCERYGQEAQAQTTYREILLRFPGEDPSGCRRKAQEALAAGETAAPAGGVFGYPEER